MLPRIVPPASQICARSFAPPSRPVPHAHLLELHQSLHSPGPASPLHPRNNHPAVPFGEKVRIACGTDARVAPVMAYACGSNGAWVKVTSKVPSCSAVTSIKGASCTVRTYAAGQSCNDLRRWERAAVLMEGRTGQGHPAGKAGGQATILLFGGMCERSLPRDTLPQCPHSHTHSLIAIPTRPSSGALQLPAAAHLAAGCHHLRPA